MGFEHDGRIVATLDYPSYEMLVLDWLNTNQWYDYLRPSDRIVVVHDGNIQEVVADWESNRPPAEADRSRWLQKGF